MFSAKAKGDGVLISVSAGGPPVHRRMTLDDARDFRDQIENAIKEVRD